MKKIISTISMALLAITFANAQAPVKTITGNLNGNVNWSNDTIYKLTGKVYVKAGGTLNIAPGTIIKGDVATAGSCLIVTRGGKINAVGTPTQPIVFTSSATPGNKSTGDWGGIVIAGNARVNVTGGIGTFEGGNLANPDGTTSDGQYGGLNDLDNSGELKYVRIEYAGFPYAPNNELNGLTMGGVGSGTKISYIQVSYGFDDSYEWFGGTVNCDHLVSFRGNDDDFDTDFGFSGKVQFGVALRDTAVADAVSGANGFESDNDAAGSGNGPTTKAIFSNMTMIGPKQTPTTTINPAFKRGAHIRRNSEESIFNSIFMGWPIGVHIDGDSSHVNADNGTLEFNNTVIAACAKNLDSTGGASWNISPWYNATASANTIYTANTDVMLTSPFDYFNPNFRPTSTSPMLTGAAFTNPKLTTGFTNVNYRGAFGADDWTAYWTNFNPDTAAYTTGYMPLAAPTVASSTPASCVPGCDGTVTFNTAASLTYTFLPTGPTATGNNVTGLCAGVIYTVTGTDATSSTVQTTIQVGTSANPATPTSVVTTNPSTTPGCDGVVTMTPAAGLVYTVSPTSVSVSGNVISGLCAGTIYTVTGTDISGCSATATISVTTQTAINNVVKNNISIDVYPNPAANVANIQFNLPTATTVTLSIIDMNGKVISSNTEKLNAGKNLFLFNTKILTNGIYSVRLTSNEFVATQKLSVIK
jgi:hypothetical protein